LLLDNSPPVPVLGGPGFGKSTVCLTALHDPRVAERFGVRRWFIRCDAANTSQDVLKEIALALGLPIATSLGTQVFSALAQAPGVLVLDNAETPWEVDTLPTEDLLARLGSIPGLALIAAVRGQQRPHGPPWRDPPLIVTPLGLADSRKAFLAIAGEKHATDSHLADLLQALDGIPLAIELLAYDAQAEPNLDGLWHRWQDERAALLRRADGTSRLVNAAVSFELSISGRRMTDEARQLLSILAILPDGIAHEDLSAVMPSHSQRAAGILRQVGLGSDEGGRLRVLLPIREHVATRHPPSPESLAPPIGHYTGLALELGDEVGREGGDEASRRLAADARNIEAMVIKGLGQSDPKPAIRATIEFGEFIRFPGLGTSSLLHFAREVAHRENLLELEANCIKRLADISIALGDYKASRALLQEAQSLYEKLGKAIGEANCIKGLGYIALVQSDYETARTHHQAARRLYQRAGDILGNANCIHGLGEIELRCSNYGAAADLFEEAQPLYEKVDEVLGKANCILGLGQIALERSEHKTARMRFGEAQSLYHQVGDVQGEANCICALGDVALAQSDSETARTLWEDALERYERVRDLHSAGYVHMALARLLKSDSRRKHHIAAAREAWQSLARDDLIQELDAEFGAI
jgi:tetratricopeptide (TPR) repeat protein